MSSEKVFGFEKPKTKTHVLSFRLDDLHMAKLKALFEDLDIHPRKDTKTNRMILLIDRVGDLMVENQKARTERRSYAGKIAAAQTEKERLANDIQVLVTQSLGKGSTSKESPKSKPAEQPKERPPKIGPSPPPKPPTKPQVIRPPERMGFMDQVPKIPIQNAVMQIPMQERTRVCARGHKTLWEDQCDECAYHHYCNYSTANKHFISHDAEV